MDTDELSRFLLSDERRRYQDPLKISKAMGVKSGMIVADLACGPGFFTVPLASLVGEGGLVYAVDANPAMLRHLRINIKKSGVNRETIKVMRADVSDTTIPAGSVDVVLFANVLHDIGDRKAFLREVRRISKPRATIVDIDWEKVEMDHGPPYEIRLTRAESLRILTENGFAFVRLVHAGSHHYGLVFNPRPKMA